MSPALLAVASDLSYLCFVGLITLPWSYTDLTAWLCLVSHVFAEEDRTSNCD